MAMERMIHGLFKVLTTSLMLKLKFTIAGEALFFRPSLIPMLMDGMESNNGVTIIGEDLPVGTYFYLIDLGSVGAFGPGSQTLFKGSVLNR